MEKQESYSRTKRQMLYNNFLGGIAWAVGVWVGTTFLIVIFATLISKINLIPMVGDFISEVIHYIATVNPPLQ